MVTEEAIMLALATGAAARMEPNVFARKRREVAAYQGLVALLERAYPGIDARMMEIAPGSPERQQILAEQLRESNAVEDAAVLRQSRRVLQEIVANTPQAIVAITYNMAKVAKMANFATFSTLSTALEALEKHMEEKQIRGTIWRRDRWCGAYA
ncbi:MAG: hypothetical protein RRC07_02005 [Anaerolineae bacterium]|nr:hypothetical protein [Anaerolineae bacterium]